MKRLTYLDSFRGLAVVCVLLFHFNIFPNGFLGVEIFFVVSGYIITFLLVQEWMGTKKINLKDFYARRIARIYPPLLLMVLTTTLLFVNFPIISITNKFFSEVRYTAFGLTNWYELFHNSGYWENGVKSPLLHVWSLAIELQFYFFYPLIYKLFFNKKMSNNDFKKRFILLISTFICLLFTLTFFLSYHLNFNTLYYATFSRISSFFIGGLMGGLACLGIQNFIKSKWITLLTSLSLIGMTPLFSLNNIILFRGIILIYTILLGILLLNIHQNKDDFIVSKIFQTKFFSSIGLISFSLYLWHIPILIFFNQQLVLNTFHINIKNYLLTTIQIMLSIILACLSYFLVEKNSIKSKSGILCLSLIFPLILLGMTTEQVDARLKIIHVQKTVSQKWIDSAPIVTQGKEPLLIVGDSWSRRLAFGLDQYQKINKKNQYQILLYGVGNGSIMDPDYFNQNNQHVLPFKSLDNYLSYWDSAIKTYNPKKVLLVSGLADQAPMVIKGKETRVGDDYFNEIYQENFSKIINFFQSKGIKVYVTNTPKNARNHNQSELALNKVSDDMGKCFDDATSKQSNIQILNLKKLLSNGDKQISKTIIDNIYMYDETNHPSYDGSYYIGDWLFKNLK